MTSLTKRQRASAVNYVRQVESNIPKQLFQSIVCHRGFHDPNDGLHRPIENTLRAFTSVWKNTNGLVNCECDVTATKDGVVVVSHDDNYKRLSMFKDKLSK